MVVTCTGAKTMEEALVAIQDKLQELDEKFLGKRGYTLRKISPLVVIKLFSSHFNKKISPSKLGFVHARNSI